MRAEYDSISREGGKPLRVGIVGMGFGASVHLPAFQSLDGVQVVALSDGGSGKASAIAAKMDGDVSVFDSGVRLAQWDGVDAVSIAAPPEQHESIVRAAFESGKHVLCEKPFGHKRSAAEAMAAMARENDLVGAISFEFRYDLALRRLLEGVRSGRIGALRRISVSWLAGGAQDPQRLWSWRHNAEAGGGVLIDWCCHVFDYATQIMGAPVQETFATVRTVVQRRQDCTGVERAVTSADESDVWCRFANGTIGQFTVSNSYRAGAGHRIEVYGENGRLIFQHEPPFTAETKSLVLWLPGELPLRLEFGNSNEDHEDDDRLPNIKRLFKEFVGAINGEVGERLPTFNDGLSVWRAVDAALRSTREERLITVRAQDI